MSSVIRISGEGIGREGLSSVAFVPPEAVLSGQPVELGETHYETADGSITIGTWESTPYSEILSYPDATETVFVISGKVAITNSDGSVETIGAGDSYVLPKGFSGRFEVLETLRKLYVISAE